MRRLVLLGLLGWGVSACKPEPTIDPEPLEQPLCPELVIQEVDPAPSLAQGLGGTASAPGSSGSGAERVLVRFRRPTGVHAAAVSLQREDKVHRLGARVRYHWPSLDTLALTITPEEKARLAQDPEVLSISEDRKVHALGLSPWVPVSALLHAPFSTGSTSEYTWAVLATQANQVWDANNDGVLDTGAPTGEGISVCVIDSGLDLNHPELKAAYAGGKDFVDGDDVPEDKDANGAWGGGHGTHVAGTIAAQLGSAGQVNPNDSSLSPSGMVGVAPGVRLLVARVLDENGDGRTSDVIAALNWCKDVMKANIVSLSLGSSNPDTTEEAAFQAAWDAGLLTVAASGNGGELAPPESKIYPAAYPSVLAVGAVDPDFKHPKFSQGGAHLSLVAPGVNVYSTYPRGHSPYATLTAGGTFYTSAALDYVPFEEYEGPLIDCGLGDGLRSCPGATCEGFVAYVERGTLRFNEKVKNVRSQGARAVIIGNNDPTDDPTLGFTLGNPAAWPPVTAIPTTTVPAIRAQVGNTVKVGIRGSDYALSTGTSMATPHVSAVAALVWSARPHLTNKQVRDILEGTATDLQDADEPNSGPGHDIVFGFGMVQAKAAVDKALNDYPPPPVP